MKLLLKKTDVQKHEKLIENYMKTDLCLTGNKKNPRIAKNKILRKREIYLNYICEKK